MFCSLLLNEYGKVCFALSLQKTNIIDINIIPKIFDNSKRKFLHNMCTHNPSNKSLHQLWMNGHCIWRHKNSVWHFNFVVKLSNVMISQHTLSFIIAGSYRNKTHNWHTGLILTSDPAYCWTWDWMVQASRGHVALQRLVYFFTTKIERLLSDISSYFMEPNSVLVQDYKIYNLSSSFTKAEFKTCTRR
jgi:hypothetical protein